MTDGVNLQEKNMVDFTTIIGLDTEHVNELRLTWPTWARYRPEIMEQPLVLICDGVHSESHWRTESDFINHPDVSFHLWNHDSPSQREKMLTALTLAPASCVTTPWYLKLDTDVVANKSADWLQKSWFDRDEEGRLPVFVTSPWGYTKPANAIQRLDDWGDRVSALQHMPRLNLTPEPDATLLSHSRIISWCFFGNTSWTREVTGYCEQELPIPSQDTYLWYCAARRKDFYRAIRMKKLGWHHIGRLHRLRQACRDVMSDMQQDCDSAT